MTDDGTIRSLEAETMRVSRRQAMQAGLSIALVPLAPISPGPAQAQVPGQLAAAIGAIVKGAEVTPGRVSVRMPELAENGNSVSLVVSVESPMTPDDYVRTIHIVSEKNPVAKVARFHFTPASGRARVATNMRLALTQTVTALAEMSDGRFFSGTTQVVVTLAACIDGE